MDREVRRRLRDDWLLRARLHPRYSGRPSRLMALERLIAYIQSHEGIWFARCEAMLEFLDRHGYAPDSPDGHNPREALARFQSNSLWRYQALADYL